MSEKKSIFNLTFFITSLLCLVPIIVGFILWDKLPESIPQQYGYNDEATWSLPKLWGIITLPIFMFIINLVMHLTITFSKKRIQSKSCKCYLLDYSNFSLSCGNFYASKTNWDKYFNIPICGNYSWNTFYDSWKLSSKN